MENQDEKMKIYTCIWASAQSVFQVQEDCPVKSMRKSSMDSF